MLKSSALFVFILYTTLVVSHSRVTQSNIHPNDAQTIHNTCLETPDYNQCMKYLSDDPKSSTADVRGLALIMVNVLKSKATNVLGKINQLSETSPPDQKVAFKSCADQYNTIIATNVAQAIEGLQNGNPKLAMDNAVATSDAVSICDESFSGKSPLASENLDMDHASAITAHICRQLVLGGS